jgi:hypothetical protein
LGKLHIDFNLSGIIYSRMWRACVWRLNAKHYKCTVLDFFQERRHGSLKNYVSSTTAANVLSRLKTHHVQLHVQQTKTRATIGKATAVHSHTWGNKR